MQRFYWPTLHHAFVVVAVSVRRPQVGESGFIPLPILSIPFDRIATETVVQSRKSVPEVTITVGHRPKTAHKPRVAVHFRH